MSTVTPSNVLRLATFISGGIIGGNIHKICVWYPRRQTYFGFPLLMKVCGATHFPVVGTCVRNAKI